MLYSTSRPHARDIDYQREHEQRRENPQGPESDRKVCRCFHNLTRHHESEVTSTQHCMLTTATKIKTALALFKEGAGFQILVRTGSGKRDRHDRILFGTVSLGERAIGRPVSEV